MFEIFSVNLPSIPKRDFDLSTYGGIGDGRTSNTAAFRKAIKAATEDGGRVVVLPGVCLIPRSPERSTPATMIPMKKHWLQHHLTTISTGR